MWFVVLLALVGLNAQGQSGPSTQQALQNTKCAKQVQAQIEQWEPMPGWVLQVPPSRKTTLLRSPTRDIGVWLELQVFEKKAAEVRRVTPTQVSRVTWEEVLCVPRLSTVFKKLDVARMQSSFSDTRLVDILKRNSRGVIYAWSPHMPYSLAAYPEVVRAAAQFGAKVFPVLDPHAIERLAARDLSKLGADAGRRMESLELFYRGMANHYPSMLFFSNGKILGPVFPGYKPEATYVEFIKERLAR